MVVNEQKIENPIWLVKDAPRSLAPETSQAGDVNNNTGVLGTGTVQSYVMSLKEKLRGYGGNFRTHRSVQPKGRARDMHVSLRGAMLACQFIGLFPTSGLMENDIGKLRFSWCSFNFLYFLVSLAGQCLMTSMCTYRMFRLGFSLGSLSNLVFYATSLASAMMFFRLAQSWPLLMRQVAELERTLPGPGGRVVRACNMTTLFVLLFASAEHILSIVFGLRVASICSPNTPILQGYFNYAMPWVFNYITFANWKGILGELFNLQATFMWNFTDVFIMVVSLHLTAHFLQLNRYIFRNKDKVDMSWREARERYGRLTSLVRLVDSRVSGLVLISFSINLFFICLQLFNSLSNEYSGHFTACSQKGFNNKGVEWASVEYLSLLLLLQSAVPFQTRLASLRGTLHGLEHSIYFTYSFSFLLLRALLVSLLAARVHSAARAPAAALYEVPTAAFSVEVQRFLDQVNFTTVALSGLEFFYVTRGMILTVVGTIVTYELVLLQFSAAPQDTTTGVIDSTNLTSF